MNYKCNFNILTFINYEITFVTIYNLLINRYLYFSNNLRSGNTKEKKYFCKYVWRIILE
ncbi:hypothetical protein Lbys_0924 [Leadbetterella byssophila DSM 17132]|uniref:Uncharacterized protein n=1 Tax=Leadbetterella byssophila (strain DSM 17132 / JCM 16389 / KACC 11308 / NBRC 106382 / 4M15) TaxID=649349 RepID=E4RRK6_LEAB4|nr:hypothetical protein Lbys_0924 [Leadbetterella byssophila DSM 17132]